MENLPLSSLYLSEPIYEGRLKVILLLQVSSRDFEPTWITLAVAWIGTVKTTQYKKLAPNAQRSSYQNLKSCKPHPKTKQKNIKCKIFRGKIEN